MPGMPRPGRAGDGRAVGARPGELRDPRLAARAAGGSAVDGLLRQGARLRRHERVEEELEAQFQAARCDRRLRRVVRADPGRYARPTSGCHRPGSPSTPGSSRSRRSAGPATRSMVSPKGGPREATGLFAWGSPTWIARMIRKPGAADRYGFLDDESEDARLRPGAGQRQRREHGHPLPPRRLSPSAAASSRRPGIAPDAHRAGGGDEMTTGGEELAGPDSAQARCASRCRSAGPPLDRARGHRERGRVGSPYRSLVFPIHRAATGVAKKRVFPGFSLNFARGHR